MNLWPGHQLRSGIFPLRIPLLPDEQRGWKPYHLFRGWTVGVSFLSCHASVLLSRRCPHPPHSHKEEELLLLLSGKVDLILPDLSKRSGELRTPLGPGQLVYYPSYFAHTLETTSQGPANYLMLKWQSRPTGAGPPLDFGRFDTGFTADAPPRKGFHHSLIFEGPTAYLQKLQCHASTLTPGAGYDPHRDPYDVAIVVLAGEVETLGRRAGPSSVIFYPSGDPHGMRNPGGEVAKYLVFEFHSRSQPSLLSELTNPQRWKKEMKHLLNRLGKILREGRL